LAGNEGQFPDPQVMATSLTSIVRGATKLWQLPPARDESVCQHLAAVPISPTVMPGPVYVMGLVQSPSHGPVVQVPFQQLVPVPQGMPQPPQLALLDRVSTQAPVHSVVPLGQAQAVPWQVLPFKQALLQAPQWELLPVTLTHTPLQRSCPAGQSVHWPAVHA
jgi:hypothetical protein